MNAIDIALAVLVLALVVWNQLRARQVSSRSLFLVPVLLLVLGLLQRGPLATGTLGVVLLVAGLALALGLGTVRGYATTVWPGPDGRFWRRGGRALLLLWLASVAVKVGLDLGGAAAGASVGGAALMLEFGATLAAQNAIVARRTVGWAGLLGTSPTRYPS